MNSSPETARRNSEMYYFTANTGSASPVRYRHRHRNRRHGLTEVLPYFGINQAVSTFSTHRRSHSLPHEIRSGTSGVVSTTTSSEADVTRWSFDFAGTLFDGQAMEEANRLADVAATVFIQPAEDTITTVRTPVLAPAQTAPVSTTPVSIASVSAPTTMEATQAVVIVGNFDRPMIRPVLKKAVVSPVPVTPARECLICTEKFVGEEVLKIEFPFHCGRCGKNSYCGNCISKWFMDACRNESKMPPKCCYAIPITTISKLLDADQVRTYNLKHEEWMTEDRTYCPIPSCSAFIPPRLIKAASERNANPSTPPPEHDVKQDAVNDNSADNFNTAIADKVTVCCPDCHTKICTSCRAISHTGNCSESDIDPELEAALERWKIKRCPKCRTGVRRMYGCNHVECHCGAHFCYACMRSYNECDGECGDEDEDDNDSVAEDDLDGREDWGDNRNIGEEPAIDSTDMWGCLHRFFRMDVQTVQMVHQECQRCFKSLIVEKEMEVATEDGYVAGLTVRSNEDVIMTGTSEAASVAQAAASEGWTCACGRVVCGACKNLEEEDGE